MMVAGFAYTLPAVGLLALILSAPTPLDAQEYRSVTIVDVDGETKDRLPRDRMAELVAGPMAVLECQGLAQARLAFDESLAATVAEHGPESVERADLITSFAVMLYESPVEEAYGASLEYLQQSIIASREAFGSIHPETALALHSYAIAAVEQGDARAAQTALNEAYSIRVDTLGHDDRETVAALSVLATIDAMVFRPDSVVALDAHRRLALDEKDRRKRRAVWQQERNDSECLPDASG